MDWQVLRKTLSNLLLVISESAFERRDFRVIAPTIVWNTKLYKHNVNTYWSYFRYIQRNRASFWLHMARSTIRRVMMKYFGSN